MFIDIPISDLAKACSSFSRSSKRVTHFHIDSRKIGEGGVFFALLGERVDGHQYLEQVAKNKGIGAVVRKDYSGADFGLELIRVDRVERMLHKLAKKAFSTRRERVVAITGSMGKTTTKEFLVTLLETSYRVAKTPGNYNTQLTLPLTLLNLKGEHDLLVLEMGMSKQGHIRNLVDIAPPDFAILTRIAPAGLEKFEGLEAVARAKSEIFSQPKTTLGLVSQQVSQFKTAFFAGGTLKEVYGWVDDFSDSRQADFPMRECEGGVVIGESPVLRPPFTARHLLECFCGAVSAARMLGVSWEEIQQKAPECMPFENRFEMVEKGGVTFVSDCYNANPDSMCAALDNLPAPAEGGKRIGVLGCMADLGTSSEHFHKKVGRHAQAKLDRLLCIGREAKTLERAFCEGGKEAEFCQDLTEIRGKLSELMKPGDVVLLKGANVHNLWKVLED